MTTVTTSAPATLLTTEDLLAMPDDGTDRWLINGELREQHDEFRQQNGEGEKKPMTTRSFAHSAVEATMARLLGNWLATQPKPRGRVLSGEARVRLRRNPDATVGIDVACTGPNPVIGTIGKATFLEGPPLLAIEILSPSDEHEDVTEKVLTYLKAGVPLVWVVDPSFQTVRVHRPDTPPVLYNIEHELTAEPVLPGFRVRVAELFEE